MLVIFLGYFINYLIRKKYSFLNSVIKILLSLTYGMPGAFIAISIIIYFNTIINLSNNSSTLRYIVYGTVFGLVYSLVFRFINIAVYTFNSGSSSIKPEVYWCTQIYGPPCCKSLSNKVKNFFWNLPMHYRSIAIVFFISFIDCIKELPITLILRIRAYELINDERYEQAATISLILISVCILFSCAFLLLFKARIKAYSASLSGDTSL